MEFQKDELFLQFQGFLKTPQLWKSQKFFNFPTYTTSEVSLPENLQQVLQIGHSVILGKRMESFFAYYVENYTAEKILISSRTISRGKITLGEIDFLLQNKNTQRISHVELIYKFFIYEPEYEKEEERWIGPNRKDTLLNKLNRLKNHQFPLLYHDETRELFHEMSCSPEDIVQKVCFKANLFVPRERINEKFALVNNECIQGYWIKREKFKVAEYNSFSFHTPKKANWPIHPKFCNNWVSFNEIKPKLFQLLDERKSPLVWMKKNDKEFYQFFIVWW